MIKFFRQIRYNLMNQNKASKYFKYAIGEIILVVIGILIALSINNWNEEINSKKKERLALIEILTDLEYNIVELDSVKSRRLGLLKSVNALEILIETMETNKPYHDSLGIYFNTANSYDEADFKISGYNSLNSIGMDLIEDPKIRSSIGQYFTSSIADYKSAFNEVVKDFHEYMLPFMRKEFTLINMHKENRALIPNDYEALKNNKEYIQSLRTFLDVQSYYLNVLNLNLDNAVKLKQDMKEYINE
ncbi:DUF6090 family protein [Winogradskyella sp. MIT101101]|uniref:DUF6090 family protein n=1 Tax=Winogradskyella sp. MIT101101 TaxID=3098297 RepID=UPI00399A5575